MFKQKKVPKQGTFLFVFTKMKGEHMQEYHKYLYDGPVMEFDRCINNNWTGETMAPTETKARTNLTYQFKKMHGKITATKISLPGKITMVN